MPTPSLLIVPARFKSGKLYSQIPTSGAGDFTVTRATAATRVNASGFIESVASGIPRLDYFASGGVVGCPALLVEPSGSNLALQSAAWNVSPWAATSGSQGATVSGNVTTSPDGTTNADKLIEAATTGTHFCLQNLTLTSGTTYTASFFVKASERTLGRLRMSGSGAYWDLSFNLTSGTATGGTNSFIQNYGNGWYRIGATFTANQASNDFVLSLRDASGNTSYTGDGTSGLFVWGAQVEVGSVATSYIPTTTGSVTRNAEVISVSGAVSGSIGQTEGTIYAEVDVRLLGTACSFFSLTLNSNSTDFINFQINTSNKFFVRIRNKSGSVVDVVASGVTTTAGIHKLACSYSSGDITLALDGVIIGTNTNANTDFTAALNCLLLGSGPAATTGSSQSGFANDRIRAAALYTTRLTNAELAALTTP